MSADVDTTCSLHRSTKAKGEKRLLIIIAISAVTMVAEVVGGTLSGSMALLADGWHMGTHVLALGVAYAACRIARHIAGDTRFAFGPSKVSALGGFAGAIMLGFVAFEMIGEGIHRLLDPWDIMFDEAILIAVVGLLVNTVGALLLRDNHHHGPGGEAHHHEHGQRHGHDQNMRSAYLHVITDALTSVLAIAALVLGKWFGWIWLDAAVALLGGAIILKWGYGLLKSSGATLLDFVPDTKVRNNVHAVIRGERGNHVQDLHLWPNGERYGLLATVLSHDPDENTETIKSRLCDLDCLDHVTLEVRDCTCHRFTTPSGLEPA